MTHPRQAAAMDRLLAAPQGPAREGAWAEFVAAYSRLLLYVAGQAGGGHDQVMDRYAYLLHELRRDDLRRLRSYAQDGRSQVSTWLVVVARRLCLDHHRQRYGRTGAGTVETRRHRRELADLLTGDAELELMPMDESGGPELTLRRQELARSLRAALATLPTEDRLLLRLRFQDELPVAEIAPLLKLPTIFHVYRRLNATLDRLRATLRQSGIEDAAP
jgi:RNA polymerase sigma factor (sigma-70 family)